MRRPTRSVTVKRSADAGVIEVRAGERVLGQVSGLASETQSVMNGTFTHRPAYADLAQTFLRLARALAAGATDEAAALHAEIDAAGVGVWHTSHDMRIDRPRTLLIADGRATFMPNDAFMMMRTGAH